jgi:hypothetical protein
MLMSDAIAPPHSSSLLLTPPHFSSLLLTPPHSSSFLLTPPHSSSFLLISPHSSSTLLLHKNPGRTAPILLLIHMYWNRTNIYWKHDKNDVHTVIVSENIIHK